jgi:hypothetical protein
MQLLLAGIRMAEATLINKYPFQCGLNAERAVEDDASLLTSSAVMSGRSFKCYLTENISRYLSYDILPYDTLFCDILPIK